MSRPVLVYSNTIAVLNAHRANSAACANAISVRRPSTIIGVKKSRTLVSSLSIQPSLHGLHTTLTVTPISSCFTKRITRDGGAVREGLTVPRKLMGPLGNNERIQFGQAC